MEAPSANKKENIINKEKTIEITSNKNNLYKIILINEESSLLIKAKFVDSIQTLNRKTFIGKHQKKSLF